jgi:transcriptional regulator with XRE-family HTH domain
MIVGDRLRAIREMKKLSQGDIEKSTGLLRCYISRVENCHTLPSIETLEKMVRALDVTMAQFFHDGNTKPPALAVTMEPTAKNLSGKDAAAMAKIREAFPRMGDRDKSILVNLARKMARR